MKASQLTWTARHNAGYSFDIAQVNDGAKIERHVNGGKTTYIVVAFGDNTFHNTLKSALALAVEYAR